LEVQIYTFLDMCLMEYGSQGHKPSAIHPEKQACALYKKLCELQ
jgi:hypothetical protein